MTTFTLQLSDDGTTIEQVWVDGEVWTQPLVLATPSGWGGRLPELPVEALSLHNNLTDASNQLAEVAMATGVVEGFAQGKAWRKNGKRNKRDKTKG